MEFWGLEKFEQLADELLSTALEDTASPLCLAGLEEGIRTHSEQLEISVEPDYRGDHGEGNADETGKGKSIELEKRQKIRRPTMIQVNRSYYGYLVDLRRSYRYSSGYRFLLAFHQPTCGFGNVSFQSST